MFVFIPHIFVILPYFFSLFNDLRKTSQIVNSYKLGGSDRTLLCANVAMSSCARVLSAPLNWERYRNNCM